MRIAVMGAGAVGGYFGARLAEGGNDVAFVARGRQLETLRTSGLRVLSPRGDIYLPHVEVTEDPAKLGRVDLVLFTVKLGDTLLAAERIRPLVNDETAVLSLQNGVAKDDILRDVLGDAHVFGGLCYIAATLAEPGLVRHSGVLQRIVVGEYNRNSSERARTFRDACVSSGIDVEISAEIERAIWEKFVVLIGVSGLTSAVRSPIGPIRDHPRTRDFLRDTMHEVVQVAQACGVPMAADYAEDALTFVDHLPADMTSSMHHDLERGNRLEVAWLSGDVNERGTSLGIATPCNRAISDILAPHTEGRISEMQDSRKPDDRSVPGLRA